MSPLFHRKSGLTSLRPLDGVQFGQFALDVPDLDFGRSPRRLALRLNGKGGDGRSQLGETVSQQGVAALDVGRAHHPGLLR